MTSHQISASLRGWQGKWNFLDTFKLAISDITQEHILIYELEDNVLAVQVAGDSKPILRIEVQFEDKLIKVFGTLDKTEEELHIILTEFLLNLGFSIKRQGS